jgi:hypothetical protein
MGEKWELQGIYLGGTREEDEGRTKWDNGKFPYSLLWRGIREGFIRFVIKLMLILQNSVIRNNEL